MLFIHRLLLLTSTLKIIILNTKYGVKIYLTKKNFFYHLKKKFLIFFLFCQACIRNEKNIIFELLDNSS